MNERIKELAGQANIHFSRIGILDGDPDGSARLVGYSKIEKLAELIVKECMTIAKNWEGELERSKMPSEADAVGIVTYRISRQFGVEV